VLSILLKGVNSSHQFKYFAAIISLTGKAVFLTLPPGRRKFFSIPFSMREMTMKKLIAVTFLFSFFLSCATVHEHSGPADERGARRTSGCYVCNDAEDLCCPGEWHFK